MWIKTPEATDTEERSRLCEFITPLVERLGTAADAFTNGGPLTHNASFWTVFFRSLIVEISGGLLPCGDRSEAEVRHELLTPLLRRIAYSLSSIEAPEGVEPGSEYWSALEYEYQTEERPSTRGSKPRVDYVMTGQVNGKLLFQIPIETKKQNTLGDIGQLAHYMSTRCMVVEKNTGIGFIIDESTLYFAFAPLMLRSDGIDLHLPIILISPKISWREGTFINRGALVSVCLFQKFSLRRETIDYKCLKNYFKEKCSTVKEFAEITAPMPPTDGPGMSGVPYDLLVDYEKTHKENVILKAKLARLQSMTPDDDDYEPQPKRFCH